MQIPFAPALAATLLSSWHASHQPLPPTLAQSSAAVTKVLTAYPILDGHVDLPVIARIKYGNDLSKTPYDGEMYGQVDLPRLRKGHVGGFWSVAWAPCSAEDDANNFTAPTDHVRDTLEQIDLTYQLATWYPDQVAVTTSPAEHRANVKAGKISHWIGIESGHLLGNSLATLRMYADLGVTYLTLTHTCHNAFADSCQPSKALHNGLSDFGRRLVKELNRLGIAVDISHTSPETQQQAIEESVAPVVYSHSGAAAVHDHQRNIKDEVLHLLRDRETVIGVPFVSEFVSGNGKSSIDGVVEHIEHIASIVGRDKVALGSDFDGALEFARGLNDTSDFPNLFVKLHQKGWTETELAGIASENFLRVYEKIQKVGKEIRSGKSKFGSPLPDMKPWEGRHDKWF